MKRRPLVASFATAALLLSGLVAGAGSATATSPTLGQSTVTGTLQRAISDPRGSVAESGARKNVGAATAKSQSKQWARLITDGGGTIDLDPASSALQKVGNGERATLTLDSSAVRAERPATVARATVLPRAQAGPTAHRAYMVVVEDPEREDRHSAERAEQLIRQSADYWVEQAIGGISAFTVSSAKTLRAAKSCEIAPFDLWDRAAKLYPDVKFTPRSGNHIVVFLPKSCEMEAGFAGVGTVGVGFDDGGMFTIVVDSIQVAAHELGHNLGLGHANLEILVDGSDWRDEYLGGYGPQTISIGNYDPGAVDVAYHHSLGVAPASTVRTVAADDERTTVTLTHAAGAPGALRGVTMTDPETGRNYYIEYRAGQGRDAEATYANPWFRFLSYDEVEYGPGVRVYWLDRAGNTFTVASCVTWDWCPAALTSGMSMSPLSNAFKVSVGKLTSTTAEVTVEFTRLETKTDVAVSNTSFGQRANVVVTTSATDAVPTGKIEVYDGAKKVATAPMEGGEVLLQLPANLAPGKHRLQARYVPDRGFAASSAVKTITVAKGTAKVKVIKKTSLKKGKRAKLTIEVKGIAKTPATGKIRVKVGNKSVTKAVKLKKAKNGAYRATVTTAKLPKGKLRIVYSGDKTYKKATYSTKHTLR